MLAESLFITNQPAVQKKKGIKTITDKKLQEKQFGKTKMCRYVLEGKKCRNQKTKNGKVYKTCRFSHHENELRKRYCALGTGCRLVVRDDATGIYMNTNPDEFCKHLHEGETHSQLKVRLP
jgi:hypothetical protein